jgi:outer membrane protein assembly factor BamB
MSLALIAGFAIAAVALSLYFAAESGAQHASTISQTPVSNISLNSSLAAANSYFDWPMYHRDPAHTGFIPINVTTVRQGWTSERLDGAIYAEPLVMGKSVFVATENNSVYSLDAGSGAVNWKANMGQPVAADTLPCGNIDPSGITGTPVIDNSTRTLYAVAHLAGSRSHELFGVNIDTGKVVMKRNVDPEGMNPVVQQERGALTMHNGTVYVPFGGLLGDCGNYLGWVMGARADSPGASLVTYMVPANREAGFWATPGPSVDPAGYLYVASGNGDSVTKYDHGNSIIKLSPSLSEASSFAPSDWASLNAADTDIGSISPAIVGHGLLFQSGKAGVGYLVNSSSLGGIGGELFAGKVCAASFGGTAFADPYLMVPCTDGLYMLKVNAASSSFSVAWHSQPFFAGSPIVTGNVVWVIDVNSATLHAYNIKTGIEVWKSSLQSVPHFVTPAASGGRLFSVYDTSRIASFDLS